MGWADGQCSSRANIASAGTVCPVHAGRASPHPAALHCIALIQALVCPSPNPGRLQPATGLASLISNTEHRSGPRLLNQEACHDPWGSSTEGQTVDDGRLERVPAGWDRSLVALRRGPWVDPTGPTEKPAHGPIVDCWVCNLFNIPQRWKRCLPQAA